jgi:hypothetical protein
MSTISTRLRTRLWPMRFRAPSRYNSSADIMIWSQISWNLGHARRRTVSFRV